MPIQSQGIITRDNVSVDVSAVAYYCLRIRTLAGSPSSTTATTRYTAIMFLPFGR
jgi:regulator of protease activity HflC (stomatin/prohibitin superfamily)